MAGSRKLATTVVLNDEVQQKPIILEAGTVPTAEQAKLITNPKAWGEESDEDETPDVVDEEPDADEEQPEGGSEDEPDDDDEDDDDEDEAPAPPAKSAPKADWVEYAQSVGVELDDNATKQDYQDAVSAL